MTKKNPEPISYGYQKIPLSEAHRLAISWLDKTLPQSQWQVIAPILKERKIPQVAKPVIQMVKSLKLIQPRVLDVGCSSGYYYDFFKWAGLRFQYSGCDVSPHFISLAKKKYGRVDFKTAPITRLPYRDNSFDIILASGVLHYELDYQQALRELTRVSSKYILLHRLPVFATNTRTGISYYKKIGYGVEMVEIVFDWKTLIKMFWESKLNMKQFLAGDRLDIKPSAY